MFLLVCTFEMRVGPTGPSRSGANTPARSAINRVTCTAMFFAPKLLHVCCCNSVGFALKNKESDVLLNDGARRRHALHVVKCLSGLSKVRYPGLVKNTARMFAIFALANLYLVRRRSKRARSRMPPMISNVVQLHRGARDSFAGPGGVE